MRNTTFIYGLYCPITNELRYIGKSNDVKSRLNSHRKNSKKLISEKDIWINSLIINGQSPLLRVIEEVKIEDWKCKEKFYIKYFLDNGCRLLNQCGGGNGMNFGNKTSFKGKPFVKVTCLDRDGNHIKTFDSIKDATEFNGKRIYNILIGKRKSSGGYLWLFTKEYERMSASEIKIFIDNCNNNKSKMNGVNTRFKKGNKSHNIKSVKQLNINGDLIKIWNSITEASICLSGKPKSAIGACLCGKSKTALGFRWEFN